MKLSGIFTGQNRIGRMLEILGSIILINLLFVVTLLPVVTAGAGLTGMYYSLLKLAKYGDVRPLKDFARGFRANVKEATIAWILVILLGVFLAVDLQLAGMMPGISSLFVISVGAIALMCTLVILYLFPVMAAFEGRLRDHLKFSVYFIGKNVLYALIIFTIHMYPLFVTYRYVGLLPLAAFLWVMLGFAAIACVESQLLIRLFLPYLAVEEDPVHPEETAKIQWIKRKKIDEYLL